MTGPAIDPRDLRVSDDERSHVLALLEKATGRGLIDLAEYTERSAKVISARTRGDLNAVLLDLPGLQIAGRSVYDAHMAAGPPSRPVPGFSGAVAVDRTGGVLELTGWGSRTFKGYWTAPPLIVIGGTGASTRLDFTAAQLISPTVTIEFRSNYGGAAEFVVPNGQRRAGRGSADARRPHQQQGPAGPRYRADDADPHRRQEERLGDRAAPAAGNVLALDVTLRCDDWM